MTSPQGVAQQPISHVRWVPADSLRGNGWNPNRVAPPELRLLKLSILENGWTQPIVDQGDSEIADGYHRYTLGLTDRDVQALTGGLVPVVSMHHATPELARMATVRHNRARGTHGVLKMADIVRDLIDDFDLTAAEVGRRLSMDPEEVSRLYDRGNMLKRAAQASFGRGWVPE